MDINEAYKKVVQNRSNFQLEHFVLGQHFTPEQKYYQLLVEAKGLQENIVKAELKIQKTKAECEELRATGKKSDAIEADIKELEIPKFENELISSQRELNYLEKKFEEFPEYTREQIEDAQLKYWENRLTRVAQIQFFGSKSGVNWGQLEALQQANFLEAAISEIPTLSHLINPENMKEVGNENE